MKEKPTRRGFLGRLLAMPAISVLPTGAEKWVEPHRQDAWTNSNVPIYSSAMGTWATPGNAYVTGELRFPIVSSEDAWKATAPKK